MNDVTITLSDGTVIVLAQDQIVRPRFECGMEAEDYIGMICANGIIYNPTPGDATFIKVCPCGVLSVEFTKNCT